ncbi:hypothetical protein FOZ63_020033 [Perkinsus olseni]|uniref:Uncharacterized protein n=1 Tax=Perkinsus olseni TaxID=32597 RepID=A0A7J6Q6D3_PEROL|nr:hypothetical protein FOZ63_020033 [Perkinsus olseni]KAF4751625.1 hypothetical protein FOZ62_031343 [Perkinsus olseni]
MSVARLYFFRHHLLPRSHPVVYTIREGRLGQFPLMNRLISLNDELDVAELTNRLEFKIEDRSDPRLLSIPAAPVEKTLLRCAVITFRGVPDDRPSLVVYYDPHQHGPAEIIEWARASRRKMILRVLKWLSMFVVSTSSMALVNLALPPGPLLHALHLLGLPFSGLCGARALKLSLAASGGTFLESSIVDGMVEFIPVRLTSFDRISKDLVSIKYACLKAEHSLQAPGLARFMEWRIKYDKAGHLREGSMPLWPK